MSETGYDILKLLTQQPIYSTEILKYLNISTLTLKHNIKLLNEKLEEFNLPDIKCTDNIYYLNLNRTELELFYKLCSDYSQTQRLQYLLLRLLLEETINLEKTRKELKVSRTTILRDIEKVKKQLKAHDMDIFSLAWQGLFLKKNNENKFFEFLCEVFIKIYYEFESLPNIVKEYLKNTEVKNYKNKIKIFYSLYEDFGLQIGEFTLNYLLALDICFSLYEDFYLETIELYLLNLKENKNFGFIYRTIKKKYEFKDKFILYIAMGIYFNFHQNTIIKKEYISIADNFSSFFQLNLNEDDKYSLCLIIHFSKFRFKNKIYSIKNKYSNSNSNKKLLKYLVIFSKQFNINILYGDLLYFLSYTKEIIINNNVHYKKILILKKEVNQGYTDNLKIRLKEFYPDLKIEIRPYIYLTLYPKEAKSFDCILSEFRINLNKSYKIYYSNDEIISIINEFLIEEHLIRMKSLI